MRGRRGGQSLAEFALVLPIFLILLLGLFDVGRLIFVYNGLTNAAREGARLAIVNQDKPSVKQRAQEMAFGTEITTAAADVVTFFRAQPSADDVESNSPCGTDAAHPMAVGCIAVVDAETTWQPITPIIGSIVGPINLEARSELSVELVCPNAAFAAYASADLCPKQP